jgi:peptidoglycan hydrolase-like protein with peptidoglycan-binding domain
MKIVKLTESDLSRIVKRVLAEQLTEPQSINPKFKMDPTSVLDTPSDSDFKQRGAVKNPQGKYTFPCLKKLESKKVAGTTPTEYNIAGTTYTFLETGVYTRENRTGKTQGTWKCDTQGFVELDGKQKLGKPFQWKQAPTAEEVKTGAKLLRYGMMGDFVATVQNKLKSVGINPGAIDKKFGQNTLKAIKDFQRKNGLKDDGLVGKKTYAAMFEVKPQAQPEQTNVTPIEKTTQAQPEQTNVTPIEKTTQAQPEQTNVTPVEKTNVTAPKSQVQTTAPTQSTGEIPTDNF